MMRLLLTGLAAATTRRPVVVLWMVAAATVALAALASTAEIEVEPTELGREGSEPVAAMDRVRNEFGDPTAAVQVILDAGAGGDILTSDGLQAMTEAEELAVDVLGPAIRRDQDGQPQVLSLQLALAPMLAALDDDTVEGPAAVGDELGGVAEGARQLADGLERTTAGVRELEQRLSDPAGGPGDAAGGIARLREAVAELRSGLAAFEAGLGELGGGLAEARDGVGRLRADVAVPSERSVREAWRVLTEDFTVGTADPAYRRAVESVGETYGRLTGEDPRSGEQISPDYDGLAAALADVVGGLDDAVAGLERLRGRVNDLDAGMDRIDAALAEMAGELTGGPAAAQLPGRITELREGLERLVAGAEQLATGLEQAVGQLGDAGVDGGGAAPPQVAAAVRDARIGLIAARTIAASSRLAGLVSDDLDLDEGRARATVLVVRLDPQLDQRQGTAAAERLREAFADEGPADDTGARGDAVQATDADEGDEGEPGAALADVETTVWSSGLFEVGLTDAVRAEAPPLFAVALLVVLAVLAVIYRSVFDVVVGFIGMVVTVVWTFGFAALLGPANLGWTGPLSQLAVIIPVLLVGLGIDYSVHLTARYREQRAAGESPVTSAGRAVHTVGAALVLSTAATAIGFASIATAPVQMISDFGVFVAVGMVCAVVVMGLLVPAARVHHDRRAGAGDLRATGELRLARLMRGPAWLASRWPVTGLLVAAVLVGASLLAATELEVEFDRDDFIPEGSEVEAVLGYQDELFGAGVTESTFVLVDGDLTDPAVANALWRAQQDFAGIDGVRTVDGDPQAHSVVSLAAAVLTRQGPDDGSPRPGGGSIDAAQRDAWTGDGFAADADLAAIYDVLRDEVGRAEVDQVLAPDGRSGLVQVGTTAGDAGAERMRRELHAALAPVRDAGADTTVTSEPIIMTEMSDDLSAFQARAIALTLAVVLALLTVYYALTRHWLLGVIVMIPAVASASLVVGTMWLLGIAFNAVTATLTAVAVGIGVPYGVHVVNRFTDEIDAVDGGADAAAATTLHATGAALAGSALTTLGAFVVLSFSDLPPIRSLGLLGGTAIAFALLAAVLVEPGALVLWGRRREEGRR